MWVFRVVSVGFGRDVYSVGFFSPDGVWNPEGDQETREAAAARVHYLNGGN